MLAKKENREADRLGLEAERKAAEREKGLFEAARGVTPGGDRARDRARGARRTDSEGLAAGAAARSSGGRGDRASRSGAPVGRAWIG